MAEHYAKKMHQADKSPKAHRTKSNNRFVFLIIGAVFFLFVGFATVYSLMNYSKTLPVVSIAQPRSMELYGRQCDMVLPKEYVYGKGDGSFFIYSVDQRDGAWGFEYYIKESNVSCVQAEYNDDNDVVAVYSMENTDMPIVGAKSAELYDEMRVMLR